mgnify:FL=1
MKETFGQRFSRLRKAKGLRQEDIAEKINISPQAVSKWENDISLPDITILSELSDLLGVSLDELLGKESKRVEMVAKEVKDFSKMMLRVVVNSKDGDKVRVNLPMPLVKILFESGMKMPEINGQDYLNQLDLKQIIALVEQGVIGEIVTVDSEDGDHIAIVVE